MALTIATQVGPENIGLSRKETILKVTFDSSYPTGGEAIDLSNYADEEILHIDVGSPMGAAIGYKVVYTNDDMTDLDGGTLQVLTGDNDNAADGPMVEVANATNLATLIVTIHVIAK